MTDYNPYQTPESFLGSGDVAATPALAGRGIRLLAVLINWVLGSIVTIPFNIAFRSHLDVYSLMNSARDLSAIWSAYAQALATPTAMLCAGVVLAFQIYQGYLYVTTGQTLGKKWMGIRVVRTDGRRVGGWRLIGLREVVPLVVVILLAFVCVGPLVWLFDHLCIFRASHQTLRDQLADTMVVQA